jgi:hypothetical protein
MRSDQWLRIAPEKTVVNEQEVHSELGGLYDGLHRSVHCCADAPYGTAMFDLQAVERSRVVLELARAKEIV